MRLLIFILLFTITDPLKLSQINGLKSEANEAYLEGNYQKAIQTYAMLCDSLGVSEDEVLLNLAHSYYRVGDTANAKTYYRSVASSPKKPLKSVASQQLGVLSKDAQKLEESLTWLKSAIKADPTNAGAKYDYEVVKKLLEQQQKQDQENQDQNKDQENEENKEDKKDQDKQDQQNKDKQDQKDQESKDKSDDQKSEDQKEGEDGEKSEDQKQQEQEGEKSDEQKEKEMSDATKQKLQEMNISEEKAKMILEALKNNEIQYIQQQKRQPTQQKDSGKPDW